MVDQAGQGFDITHTGLRFVENRRREPLRHGDNYTMNIGVLEGGVQQGPNNIQHVNIVNNQPLSEILPELLNLIKAVTDKANFDGKDDVIRDLEKVRDLILANPQAAPRDNIWTRINAKLIAAKTSMEIAGFVVNSYPHWPQVLEFIREHIK